MKMVQAIDQEILAMNSKEASNKLDKLLLGQVQTKQDLAVLQERVDGIHEIVGEYKIKVNRIEQRQWKISSFTAAVGAFIAYLFKK